jgi:hypothetical protein
MTTIEAKITVKMPWYEYGITSRTLVLKVENGEDIMEIIIQQLKEIKDKEWYYERVEKNNVTFDSLIVL